MASTGYATDPTYLTGLLSALPAVNSSYGSAPSNIKVTVTAPKNIKIQVQDAAGNPGGQAMASLETEATMNGQ